MKALCSVSTSWQDNFSMDSFTVFSETVLGFTVHNEIELYFLKNIVAYVLQFGNAW